MTTEQEFFEAFGIEPKEKGWCPLIDRKCINCKSKPCKVKSYPPITPEIVLKLEEIIIDIWGSYEYSHHKEYCYWIPENGKRYYTGETRINALLECLMSFKDEIQDQVRGIFNE